MKVILISDSHGFSNNIHSVLEKEAECKTVIFLGDGIQDIQKVMKWFPNHTFICVKGNNDFYSFEDEIKYKCFNSYTVVITHGHNFSVRQSRRSLISHAQGVLANAALYGHTHKADNSVDELTGIRVVNPGALCDGRYAVLTFDGGEMQVDLLRL